MTSNLIEKIVALPEMDLTAIDASVTWDICSYQSCVPTQGGVDIPRHRHRPVIDRIDNNDVEPAITLGEFHIANGDAPTCRCGCQKLGNAMYDGYSKWCHDLREYQAKRLAV